MKGRRDSMSKTESRKREREAMESGDGWNERGFAEAEAR
jgi:hypothetical protein